MESGKTINKFSFFKIENSDGIVFGPRDDVFIVLCNIKACDGIRMSFFKDMNETSLISSRCEYSNGVIIWACDNIVCQSDLQTSYIFFLKREVNYLFNSRKILSWAFWYVWICSLVTRSKTRILSPPAETRYLSSCVIPRAFTQSTIVKRFRWSNYEWLSYDDAHFPKHLVPNQDSEYHKSESNYHQFQQLPICYLMLSQQILYSLWMWDDEEKF